MDREVDGRQKDQSRRVANRRVVGILLLMALGFYVASFLVIGD